MLPRSLKAQYWHRVSTYIKLVSILGFAIFFPVSSIIWRIIAGIISGGLLSSLALKVAGDRRYRDYTADGPLTEATMMEALKRLRNMVPHGPRDRVDIDATIFNTMKTIYSS